jgi:hypothetical protein
MAKLNGKIKWENLNEKFNMENLTWKNYANLTWKI